MEETLAKPQIRVGDEAFLVIEPSGKEYRIYADGRVEGFEQPAIIYNRIPALMRRHASSMSVGSPCPTRNDTDLRDGVAQGLASRASNVTSKSFAAAGEK